jgi:hypothetical protein
MNIKSKNKRKKNSYMNSSKGFLNLFKTILTNLVKKLKKVRKKTTETYLNRNKQKFKKQDTKMKG